MARSLKTKYPTIEKVVVVSNAAFLPTKAPRLSRMRSTPERLGFISNISFEKGILEFLDVMGSLRASGIEVRGYVAGPFQDAQIEEEVKKRLRHLPHVEYVGPKYGEGKSEFFEAIDVLLFPTKYANEAEPVTILEAFAHGVPVVGWERGCLASMIAGAEGFLVPRSADFVSAAVRQILAWRNVPETFRVAADAAVEQFQRIRARDAETLAELLCDLRQISNFF
jgi:glycosyltransferase involved in cell wall biosynthesis